MKWARKLLDWRLTIVVMVVVGYIVYKPEVIPDPAMQQKVIAWREQIRRSETPTTEQVGQSLAGMKDKILGVYTSVQEEERIPGLPEQVVVDEVVKALGNEVKAVPLDQLKEVKRQFCQDVIDEATESAFQRK